MRQFARLVEFCEFIECVLVFRIVAERVNQFWLLAQGENSSSVPAAAAEGGGVPKIGKL